MKYHNIVGNIPDTGLIGHVVGGSDGIVSVASAHLDDVDSEIEVNANHSEIHRHPRSVLEVHRVLLEHLTELKGYPPGQFGPLPLAAAAADRESERRAQEQ